MDGMQVVEHHWNGVFGRLTRRDVWLRSDGYLWDVEICKGGPESGHRATWTYVWEAEARAMVAKCLQTGGDSWTRLPADGAR